MTDKLPDLTPSFITQIYLFIFDTMYDDEYQFLSQINARKFIELLVNQFSKTSQY